MPSLDTRRIRICLGFYILFIYLTLPLLPPFILWLKKTFGTGAIAVVSPCLAGAAFIFLLVRLKRRLSLAAVGLSLLPATAGGLTVLYHLRGNPVEQIHLLEYGLVGYLGYHASAFWERRRYLSVLAFWTALVIGTGIIDELIQGLLPNRVCDPRDMWINSICGLLGLITASLAHVFSLGEPFRHQASK